MAVARDAQQSVSPHGIDLPVTPRIHEICICHGGIQRPAQLTDGSELAGTAPLTTQSPDQPTSGVVNSDDLGDSF